MTCDPKESDRSYHRRTYLETSAYDDIFIGGISKAISTNHFMGSQDHTLSKVLLLIS